MSRRSPRDTSRSPRERRRVTIAANGFVMAGTLSKPLKASAAAAAGRSAGWRKQPNRPQMSCCSDPSLRSNYRRPRRCGLHRAPLRQARRWAERRPRSGDAADYADDVRAAIVPVGSEGCRRSASHPGLQRGAASSACGGEGEAHRCFGARRNAPGSPARSSTWRR